MSHFNDYIFSELASGGEMPDLYEASTNEDAPSIWDPTGIAKNSKTRGKTGYSKKRTTTSRRSTRRR